MKQKKLVVGCRLSESDKKKLEKMSKIENRSISQIINILIKKYLEVGNL